MSKPKSVVDHIQKYGIENCKLIFPMRPVHREYGLISFTTSSDNTEMTMCEFYEKRYKIDNNYKIEFKSIDKNFGAYSTYISDLEIMLRLKEAIFMVYDCEIEF